MQSRSPVFGSYFVVFGFFRGKLGRKPKLTSVNEVLRDQICLWGCNTLVAEVDAKNCPGGYPLHLHSHCSWKESFFIDFSLELQNFHRISVQPPHHYFLNSYTELKNIKWVEVGASLRQVGGWSWSHATWALPQPQGATCLLGPIEPRLKIPYPGIIQLSTAAPDFGCFQFCLSWTWIPRSPPNCTKLAGQPSPEKYLRKLDCPLCDCSWLTFPGHHPWAPALPSTCWHIIKSCWHDTTSGRGGSLVTLPGCLFTFFQCK